MPQELNEKKLIVSDHHFEGSAITVKGGSKEKHDKVETGMIQWTVVEAIFNRPVSNWYWNDLGEHKVAARLPVVGCFSRNGGW